MKPPSVALSVLCVLGAIYGHCEPVIQHHAQISHDFDKAAAKTPAPVKTSSKAEVRPDGLIVLKRKILKETRKSIPAKKHCSQLKGEKEPYCSVTPKIIVTTRKVKTTYEVSDCARYVASEVKAMNTSAALAYGIFTLISGGVGALTTNGNNNKVSYANEARRMALGRCKKGTFSETSTEQDRSFVPD
ncbi:MAG: hypothetical protein AABZ44_01750 [Elusimicrobiota bacterium]